MAPMIGTCKLCLRPGLELKDSHYLSRGIYKIIRDDTEKNPNPWMLTAETAVQTSRQMTAYLLCGDCEQRFSKNGEAWVLKHCLRSDGSFALASILDARIPDVASPTNVTRLYRAGAIPEINIAALAYFAVSIFWRGSIYPWNDDGSIPVRLGPFQEQFRQYLMGLGPFPKDCALWVMVREGKEISRLTHAPLADRHGNFHRYKFPMPGFAFSLLVGKNIPTKYREMCFVRGPGSPISRTPIIEGLLQADAIKLRRKSLSVA